MEGLSSYWELIFTSRNGGLNRRDQYIKEMIPSRELTYPLDKAYLKMMFLFPRWDMLISWRVLHTSYIVWACL